MLQTHEGSRGSGLTRMRKTRSLVTVKKVQPTLFGLTKTQVTELAAQAATEAVRATVQAGRPVTGVVGGKVVTLDASDPLLARFRSEASDARAA